MNKKKIMFILLPLAIFGGLGFYIKNEFKWPVATLKEEAITKKIGDLDIEGSGDFTVSDIKLPENQNLTDKSTSSVIMPDLDREIKISVALSEEAAKAITNKIKEVSAALKKDPASSDNWLDLGRLRSSIGDYEGARLCWEYAAEIRPENFVPFNNLAELYGYHLKDYPKAEENYAKAIEKGPETVFIYRNAYEFYRFALKNDAKAKEILQKGIAANPGETSRDLQNLLSSF